MRQNQLNPTWDYKPEYVNLIDNWKQAHNPLLWLKNSCVWYSQIITAQLGIERFNDYLGILEYGNKDTSGVNALQKCWLSDSLAISPEEQINFLNKRRIQAAIASFMYVNLYSIGDL